MRRSAAEYLVLLIGCLFIAGAAAYGLAVLTEPDDVDQTLAQAELRPVAPSSEPSIALPVQADAPPADALRHELLQAASELLNRFSELPEALHVAALIHSDLQQTQEAARIWEECIALAADEVGPYVGLARVQMELGEDEQAVETLQAAAARGAVSADLYRQLGKALARTGQLEEADAVLQQGLQRYPQDAQQRLQRGQLQLQLGQVAEAEESLKAALASGAVDGSVYFSLATAAARLGKTEEAAQWREKFAQWKQPDQPAQEMGFQAQYDHQLAQIAVASFARAAAVYDRMQRPAEAERLFLRAVALDPANLIALGELAGFYRRQGRLADAALVQSRLVELEPQNVMHRANLASLALDLGDYASAEMALRQLVTMRPDLSVGYTGLAQLYLKTDRFEQARWFAEAALKQQQLSNQETVRGLLVLAEACRALGDQTAATTAVARAAEIAPPAARQEILDAHGP